MSEARAFADDPDIQAVRKAAWDSIRTPMGRSLRGFLKGQASDPILAMASEPVPTNLRPIATPKKGRR
jgi:hypothetical protein